MKFSNIKVGQEFLFKGFKLVKINARQAESTKGILSTWSFTQSELVG